MYRIQYALFTIIFIFLRKFNLRFKKLIIDEKVRTMHMAKVRLDNITGEMFDDLKKSISQGLREYQTARTEWARAWRVIKEYDEVTKQVANLAVATSNENNDDKFVEIIETEIELAHKQLEVQIIYIIYTSVLYKYNYTPSLFIYIFLHIIYLMIYILTREI